MFVEGTLRWQVTEDCPWDLLMALSLRELSGLQCAADPRLPSVLPTPRRMRRDVARGRGQLTTLVRATTPTDVDAAAMQWSAWWSRIVQREQRELITGLHPPHFAEFDRQLELQDVIIAHYDDAAAWANARHDEYAATSIRKHATRAADIVDIVREREHELRRQAGFFRLDIAVLPLAEPGGWIVGPGSVVVSESLRDDSPAFRRWFEPFVKALV